MSGGHLKRLSGDVAIYGSGRIALQLVGFLTLPVLTRAFTRAEYGAIETVMTVFSILMLVAPLGLESASQRSYFDYRDDQVVERKTVLGTTAYTVTVSSVVLGGLLVAFSGFVSELLLGERSHAMLFELAGLSVPIAALLNLTQEVLRLNRRPAAYVGLSLSVGLLSAAITVYLVVVADFGLPSVFVGSLAASTACLLAGYRLVSRWLGWSFSARELRIMLAYGLPFIPVAAATWATQLADRFFILAFASADDLGVYSVGAKYANLLMLAVYAFGAAWSPFFLDLYSRDREEERRVRARTLTVLMFMLTWAAVGVTASAPAFLRVFTGAAFHDAYVVVGLLSVGILAIGMNSVLMGGISTTRKTHYFVRYTAYAAVANTALNFALIPPFGIVGAASSTAVTYVLLSSLYGWRAQRLDPARFEWERIARLLGVGAALLLPANLIVFEPLWLEIAFKSLLIALFPLGAAAFGGLPPHLAASIRALIAGRAARNADLPTRPPER